MFAPCGDRCGPKSTLLVGKSGIVVDSVKSSTVLDREEQKSTGPSGPRIRCPLCGWTPRKEDLWSCTCGHEWNTFDTGGVCPACLHQWNETQCLSCSRWFAAGRVSQSHPERRDSCRGFSSGSVTAPTRTTKAITSRHLSRRSCGQEERLQPPHRAGSHRALPEEY